MQIYIYIYILMWFKKNEVNIDMTMFDNSLISSSIN